MQLVCSRAIIKPCEMTNWTHGVKGGKSQSVPAYWTNIYALSSAQLLRIIWKRLSTVQNQETHQPVSRHHGSRADFPSPAQLLICILFHRGFWIWIPKSVAFSTTARKPAWSCPQKLSVDVLFFRLSFYSHFAFVCKRQRHMGHHSSSDINISQSNSTVTENQGGNVRETITGI